ncbi:hypothetical protein [Flavobacterium sp. 14A]|uniref:hypothetical protein n=1 Tax=Flavobacterium sp. 14A TaxID=2735896 RepID=UPI00156DC7F4|nr:hypothetical protein [Flavobacterium sp. 14A]NRT13475.1 hypothetical protein [Flavobacterium sp. 14A]
MRSGGNEHLVERGSGARGATNYENVIIFEQNYADQILLGKTPYKIIMLSYLTRLGVGKDLSQSSSKTIEFILKKSEEYKTLPFDEYLKKYFKEVDTYDNEIWSKIISKLVQPAYDKSRYDEMVYVYAYLDKKYHNFVTQYEIYNQLKNDNRLPDEIKQFIGFLAGADKGIFFKQYNLTIE